MGLVNVPVLYPGVVLVGALRGANFATTADQAIPLVYPTGNGFRLNNFVVVNGQGNITGAVRGFSLMSTRVGLLWFRRRRLIRALRRPRR